MSLFLSMANLSTAGLVMASGGQVADVSNRSQTQPPIQEKKITKITVKKGEFLSKIAKKYDTTWRRIYDANKHIKHPDVIKPGDKIRIPDNNEKLKHRKLPIQHIAKVAKPVKYSTRAYTAPKPQIRYTAASNFSSGSVWDRLAQCESGGNWSINTGNGYYGGLQFTASTWLSNGGGIYASLPNLATREQQIAIATKLQAARGWSPWPACSAQLGLL